MVRGQNKHLQALVFLSVMTMSLFQNTASLQHLPGRRSLLQNGAWLLLPFADTANSKQQQEPLSLANHLVTIHLDQPGGSSLGIELMDVPSHERNLVVIKRIVVPNNLNAPLQPGNILTGFDSAKHAQEYLQKAASSYPLQLVFETQPPSAPTDSTDNLVPTTTTTESYAIRVLSPPITDCQVRTRRGDLLEINYQAHLYNRNGPIYDSSATRGTGLPYQMVLGSGDMLPGVDQGLYDMCAGEVRELYIPPKLAYGSRGNRLFDQIPPNNTLLARRARVHSVSVSNERNWLTFARRQRSHLGQSRHLF